MTTYAPMIPLRLASPFTTGATPSTKEARYFGEGHAWANISDLGPRNLAQTAKNITQLGLESASFGARAEPGDLLFSFKLSVGNVSIAARPMYTNEAIATFKDTSLLNPRYAYYMLPIYLLRAANHNIYGAPLLNDGIMQRAKVPVPGRDTQKHIADYLDRETGEIDAMLAKMEELTASLEARRGAVIDEATSAGTPTQLHYLITQDVPLTYGIVQAGPNVDDGVPYIGPSDIFDHHVVEVEQLRKTTYAIASNYQRSTVQGGDVVVSIGPAYGKTTIIPNTHSGANLTQDTARVRCDERKCQPRYVQWALRSRVANEFWDSRIMGATFRRLNLNLLAVTPVPLPSLDEQTRIADHLDEVTGKIDQMLAKTAELKDLLIERRAALITDVVTGKKQVL